jgi:hypothetical protein
MKRDPMQPYRNCRQCTCAELHESACAALDLSRTLRQRGGENPPIGGWPDIASRAGENTSVVSLLGDVTRTGPGRPYANGPGIGPSALRFRFLVAESRRRSETCQRGMRTKMNSTEPLTDCCG